MGQFDYDITEWELLEGLAQDAEPLSPLCPEGHTLVVLSPRVRESMQELLEAAKPVDGDAAQLPEVHPLLTEFYGACTPARVQRVLVLFRRCRYLIQRLMGQRATLRAQVEALQARVAALETTEQDPEVLMLLDDEDGNAS